MLLQWPGHCAEKLQRFSDLILPTALWANGRPERLSTLCKIPSWQIIKWDLKQRSPSFLVQETSFVEDDFSTDQCQGGGFGTIQAHYIYFALYFYYYYTVIYNEIIIQLTIMQNQWESWACLPATRWSHLGVMGDSDTRSVLLCPLYSAISFWGPSLQKSPLHKDGMLEREAGFSVLLWQSQDIPPWL